MDFRKKLNLEKKDQDTKGMVTKAIGMMANLNINWMKQ